MENTEETLSSVLDFCDLDKTVVGRPGFPIQSYETDHNEKQIARLDIDAIEAVTQRTFGMLVPFDYEILKLKIR